MPNPCKLVVLTGFESFADFEVNPSWEAAKTFDGEEIDSFEVKSFQIFLVYKEVKPAITRIIDQHEPAVIINLGQSYRSLISLEKVAINLADTAKSTVTYNCGTRPKDEALEPNAPAAYFTTLPIQKNSQQTATKQHTCRDIIHSRHIRMQPNILRHNAQNTKRQIMHQSGIHACSKPPISGDTSAKDKKKKYTEHELGHNNRGS